MVTRTFINSNRVSVIRLDLKTKVISFSDIGSLPS